MSSITVSLADYDNEKTSTSINIVDVNAGNYAATATALSALGIAIGGISIGSLFKETLRAIDNVIDGTPPTNKFAQRETKWLVRTIDTVTGKEYRNEIGTANLALLPDGGASFLDLSDTAPEAFVTAWEAIWRSDDGNPGTVYSIEHVGRRS